ncbi:SRPBCC domain-containing protein [Brevundimonas sp.]|uniref:SRPBCC family protein n=1 Tax=Brevundimonas sp. TaxID=1871086 RepID=UPI002737822D|nr:SRPBCC domain-containing protein [Brevundimonas sp.]MDP3803181.1 SRPBCC domain-containing protein [Brevundimonas sp.]
MTAPVEVRVEKRFRHPRERVFDAFLDPVRVGEWLFHTPDGVMEKTDYDPVVGGSFALFERRGANLARHFGKFVEIARPDRIVFDFRVDEAPDEPTRVIVTFADDGDGCVVVLTHDLAPAWAAWADRTVAGWAMILESLVEVVEAGR